MMNKYQVDSWVIALLVTSAIFLVNGVAMVFVKAEDTPQTEYFTPKDFGSAPRTENKAPTPNPFLQEAIQFKAKGEEFPVTYSYIEIEYIGEYFVTAYSDEETLSRETASGVEVHYSEDDYEPTTCAIDPRLHRFGELLMIEGKVYIAEDTGGNVKGRWVDCFVETLEEVWSWETGYKSVYSVTYGTGTVSTNNRRLFHEFTDNYLHVRSAGGRTDRGDDRRAGN